MINNLQRWQRIAALFISCSSTTVFAELPASKLSPWNQLGRAWGFGFSDGYHECPECERPAAQAKLARPAVVSHQVPCVQCEQKTSLFSKMNPFKDANAAGPSPSCGPSGTPAMTVLPPSPQMYQQFATPSETPLPGSNHQQFAPNSVSNQIPSSGPHPIYPEGSSTPPGGKVLDPIEFGNQADQTLRHETPPILQQDSVPPPPVLRKRQKGDKPLGEQENKYPPREPVEAEAVEKDKPAADKDKSDDSLDLLPKDEPAPITIHPQSRGGRSLISNKVPIREARPVTPPLDPHDAMLKLYYGGAYSRQELPESPPGPVAEQQFPQQTQSNRYRFR